MIIMSVCVCVCRMSVVVLAVCDNPNTASWDFIIILFLIYQNHLTVQAT